MKFILRLTIVATICLAPCQLAWSHGDSTWQVIQHAILDNNCANCHAAGSSFATQSDLVLTEDAAYSQLLNIVPKNSAARDDGLLRVSSAGGQPGLQQSYFWEKINAPDQEHFYNDHPQYGAIMPLGAPPLSNGQLAFIRTWIEAGAPQTGVVADPALLDDGTVFEPPPFVPPLRPTRGHQLHLGPFNVWSSQHDREFLYYQPLATTEDQYVKQYEIVYRPGSHHFILYNYPAGGSTPPPNTFRDLRDQNGNIDQSVALQIGQLFPFRMFVGTQVPYTNYHLPDNVALRLPRNAGFDLNVHSVNRSGTTQQGEVYVNLHTVDRSEVRHIADYDNCGNTNISLPPNRITTLTHLCTFSETRHFIQMWSHSHEHTVEFRIEGVGGAHDGELLYWTNDWEHPPLLQFDPPLTFQAGDRVRLVTTYNNTTNQTINFGFLGSDEMQFMFYIYYTAAFDPPGDIDLDGVVNRADAAEFVRNLGRATKSSWWTGDFNTDRRTSLADLRILQANWGRTAPNPSAPVPEPSALGLATALVALLGLRKSGRSSPTTVH